MMKKLSKAQNEIMTNAYEKIDFARSHSIEEWAMKKTNVPPANHPWSKWYIEEYGQLRYEAYKRERIEEHIERFGKYYELEKKGIILCQANSRTLNKLEELGLIKLHKDGGSYPDTIEILNY